MELVVLVQLDQQVILDQLGSQVTQGTQEQLGTLVTLDLSLKASSSPHFWGEELSPQIYE